MPFILLLAGAILAVAAFNDSAGTLATQLEQDIPAFMKWGLAVFAVGALGWVPGLATISRWLVALVMVVLVVKYWTNIQSGFQNFAANFGAGASGTQSAAAQTPATAYAANPNAPQITQSEISGTGTVSGGASATGSSSLGGNINAVGQTASVTPQFGIYDPAEFLAAFSAGFGGFGGIV